MSMINTRYLSSWEDFYPCMPLRLLAIETHEMYGEAYRADRFEDIPDAYKQFPYVLSKSVVLKALDGSWHDYLGSYPIDYDIANLFDPATECITVGYTAVMPNPDSPIIELAIRPVQPIKLIKLSAIITKDAAEFDVL